MPLLEREARIRRSFQRARPSYDLHAGLQQRMGHELLEAMAALLGPVQSKVLEIGCGTGGFTRPFLDHFHCHDLTLSDLLSEPPQLEVSPAGPRMRYLSVNAEDPSWAPVELDLICANAAFQWFEDWPLSLRAYARHLRPGGALAFSVFGPRHFFEFSALLGPGLRYPGLSEVRAQLVDDYHLLWFQERQEVFHFPDLAALFAHLRRTGVNAAYPRPLAWGELKRFGQAYCARFAGPKGLPLSLHPQWYILRRRGTV